MKKEGTILVRNLSLATRWMANSETTCPTTMSTDEDMIISFLFGRKLLFLWFFYSIHKTFNVVYDNPFPNAIATDAVDNDPVICFNYLEMYVKYASQGVTYINACEWVDLSHCQQEQTNK